MEQRLESPDDIDSNWDKAVKYGHYIYELLIEAKEKDLDSYLAYLKTLKIIDRTNLFGIQYSIFENQVFLLFHTNAFVQKAELISKANEFNCQVLNVRYRKKIKRV